ncbi:HemK2/MTQ2 family protein methyltransferase [Streptomyces sp. NPDC008150]|uniref:HemK2/MTQ2 family protein methyltransferase n=1 Tax=Streptomyces sp. NPDC008150 TaxID=3364816 RepID=UPI0036E12F23
MAPTTPTAPTAPAPSTPSAPAADAGLLSAGLGDVWTLPGVYAPQADTCLLARAVRAEGVGAGADVLEVCTGSGALAVLASRLGARVSATDISWRAVMTARLNAARAGQPVQVRRGDLAMPWFGRTFDLVLSNPPYVPARSPRVPARGLSRAWDAGRDGRRVVDRICAHASALLRPHGVLLMVHSGLCDAEATLARLGEAGLRGTITERVTVPFGPVLTERLPWLRAQGLLGADEDREELVVVRAERS